MSARMLIGAVMVLTLGLVAAGASGASLEAATGIPRALSPQLVGPELVGPEMAVRQPEIGTASWNPVIFTFTAGVTSVNKGSISIVVPSAWALPSVSASSAGYVRASRGAVSVAGRTITVRNVSLSPEAQLTIAYGGGLTGTTAPGATGTYTFQSSLASTSSAPITPLPVSPQVQVIDPDSRPTCSATRNPADGPFTSTSHHTRALIVANGIASANLWNTLASVGSISQCYGGTGLTTTISLKTITRAQGGPAGFPEVGYGHNLSDGSFCMGTEDGCHTSPFPLAVAKLSRPATSYLVNTAYSLGVPVPGSVPRDFGYDLWLERKPRRGRSAQAGDIETLIGLYHHGVIGCPSGSPSLRVGIRINGRRVSSRWNVCAVRGGSHATLVAILLKSPAPVNTAAISIPLRVFVNKAIQESAAVTQIPGRGYSLMGVELGSEFGVCDNLACTITDATWHFQISAFSLSSASATIPIIVSASGK